MVQKVVGLNRRLGQMVTGKFRQLGNGYPLQIREGSGSERRLMDSAFHMLCPRYNESVIQLPLRKQGYGKP